MLERQVYAEMAMEAIGQAPAIAAMHRTGKGIDSDRLLAANDEKQLLEMLNFVVSPRFG